MPSGASGLTLALSAGLCLAILLRIGLPAPVLDIFTGYSLSSSGALAKMHPGLYLLVPFVAAIYLSRRIELDRQETRALAAIFIFACVIAGLMAYMVAAGHARMMGYLVDTYGAAIVAALGLLAVPAHHRARIGSAVILLLVASALVGSVEYATKTRILPYALREESFRATGLAGHPLLLGLMSATAIPFVATLRWPAVFKLAAVAVLLAGTVAAGARIAQLSAMLAVLGTGLTVHLPTARPSERQQLRALLLIGATISLFAAVAVLAAGGFLDRLSGGLVDDSSMARVEIYRIFGLVSWKEILLGADVDHISYLAKYRLDIPIIESSVVFFVFQFGLIGAVVFASSLLLVIGRLLAGAPATVNVGAAIFFLVALSNNTLSAKGPAIVLLFVLLATARTHAADRAPAGRHAGSGHLSPFAVGGR